MKDGYITKEDSTNEEVIEQIFNEIDNWNFGYSERLPIKDEITSEHFARYGAAFALMEITGEEFMIADSTEHPRTQLTLTFGPYIASISIDELDRLIKHIREYPPEEEDVGDPDAVTSTPALFSNDLFS